MDVDKLTIGDVKQLRCLLGNAAASDGCCELLPSVGQKVFIRLVTHHYTGEVVAVGKNFVALKSAAWIASSGRFADAMKTGKLDEVEPYPDEMVVNVNLGGAGCDWAAWPFALPREQK